MRHGAGTFCGIKNLPYGKNSCLVEWFKFDFFFFSLLDSLQIAVVNRFKNKKKNGRKIPHWQCDFVIPIFLSLHNNNIRYTVGYKL